jgi:hypothetical protein
MQISSANQANSAVYNYKGSNCIVLLALVDTYYEFILIHVGLYGGDSDGNIFAKSSLGKSLRNDTVILPAGVSLAEN